MEEARRKGNKERCSNRSVLLLSLRELRQGRGLTQRELSRLSGVSAGAIYQLENGLRGAYPATVKKLARALEVSRAELVRGHRRE
jgi:transcriptional regulator with XRE-family HTH domain